MVLNDFFFIHIPKTGGTFVEKRFPEIQTSRTFGLSTHATYQQCKPFIDNKIVFSIVRNPYEWLESYYFFEHTRSKIKKRNPKITKYITFDSFIYDKGFVNCGLKQYEYLDSNITILKTEKLNKMLKSFFSKYNIMIDFFEEKVRENLEKKPVVWTHEMKQLVYEYYEEDFERFGYTK